MDWRVLAACRAAIERGDAIAEHWFPEAAAPGHYDLARSICNRCPVRKACLDLAMAAEGWRVVERAGMFGGRSPKERNAIARERRSHPPDRLDTVEVEPGRAVLRRVNDNVVEQC
jgi:hypothetical protein